MKSSILYTYNDIYQLNYENTDSFQLEIQKLQRNQKSTLHTLCSWKQKAILVEHFEPTRLHCRKSLSFYIRMISATMKQ